MEKHDRNGRSDTVLRIIAALKLVKVAVLLALGIAALVVVHHDPPDVLVRAANIVGVDPESRHLHALASKLGGVSTKHLEEASFGSFFYAALFAVEGVGLWMKKRWAEYFTIGITLSFVPIEIYELARRFSAVKLITLGLNVAIAVYLIVRVTSERGRRPAHARLGIASR
ncbi:MAG: hypothetical protein JWP87_4353 [Labilithrix sp.]|nr:hypothetical protein [Labilithrix sp.]